MDWILENWQTLVAIAGAVVMLARLPLTDAEKAEAVRQLLDQQGGA